MDPSASSGQVPVQGSVQPPQTQPVAGSSPLQKEREVIGLAKAKNSLSEVIQASEIAPELSQEEKEAGVEAVSHGQNLTTEHKEAGIYHAKESTPVSTSPSGMVSLPMTKQKAQSVLKTYKITDSIKWLAALILKLLKSETRSSV